MVFEIDGLVSSWNHAAPSKGGGLRLPSRVCGNEQARVNRTFYEYIKIYEQ